jgi:hypothetical protein
LQQGADQIKHPPASRKAENNNATSLIVDISNAFAKNREQTDEPDDGTTEPW